MNTPKRSLYHIPLEAIHVQYWFQCCISISMAHRLQTFSNKVSVNASNWTTSDCFACLWEIFAKYIPDSSDKRRKGRTDPSLWWEENWWTFTHFRVVILCLSVILKILKIKWYDIDVISVSFVSWDLNQARHSQCSATAARQLLFISCQNFCPNFGNKVCLLLYYDLNRNL